MENLPRNYETHIYMKSEYGKFPKKLWNPYLTKIWIWEICQEIRGISKLISELISELISKLDT